MPAFAGTLNQSAMRHGGSFLTILASAWVFDREPQVERKDRAYKSAANSSILTRPLESLDPFMAPANRGRLL
jgi:hypothetical protein